MNTNAGPNSLGASGSGTLYGGADSSAQMLQVLASSNVMPGYQNMNKDQVDWGLLAQQWIRMREWSQPVNDFVPTPPPPPSFHDTGDLSASDCGQDGGTAFDEQGEAPMEVEKEDDNLGAGSSLMLPVAAPPGHTIVDPTATAAVANWQAKMNQLYHMNLASHQAAPITGSTFAPANQRDGSSTESKSAPYLRRIDRDVKLMAESVGTGEPGPPGLNGGKDYGGGSGGESVTMNEAKRKLLPAWIREGLEKMEREKQRQQEREQERRLWEEEQRRQRSAEDEALADWSPTKPETSSALRSHEEEDGTDPPSETLNHHTEETALVTDSIEDDDEIWATFVRTTVTDILSKVTGNLIVACVTATINKAKKRKAKQVQSKQVKPGLVTCTGALGLGIYGDSDDEDEDDEEESGGKEAVSGGDSQGDESTDDDLSDSAAVQKLEETIRRKHRDFVHTTRDVEQWISSVQLSPRQKPTDLEVADGMPHTVHLPGDQDDEHRVAGIGRDELAGYGGRSAASSTGSNGDVGSKSGSARLPGSTRDGETQPVNDKLYASQQFAGGRRRLEKRVSRFSELQEPRARLPLNPPPVPPVMTYKLGALSSHASDQTALAGKGPPGDATKRAAHNPADVLLLKANQRLAQHQQRQHQAPPGVVPPAPVLTASDVDGGSTTVVGGSGSAEKNSNRYLASIQPPAKAAEPKKGADHPGEDKAAHRGDPKEKRRSDRSGSRQHDQRKSHAHRERSEREQRHHQDYYHRKRSRSKSSRSYTRSPHSVSRSTRSSRSSRSRSRSKSHRADHSSSTRHHRHRSDRSRRHHSRSWSRSSYSSSRSTSSSRSSVSQERSRSTERRRDAPTSKLFTRRPE